MSKPSTHTAPRTHRFLALLWPALALLACAALWTAAMLRADAEHRRAEEQAFKEADAYAEAYEQYVTRSLAQMDQITMQLKHSWSIRVTARWSRACGATACSPTAPSSR
jgi:hypothetical protein